MVLKSFNRNRIFLRTIRLSSAKDSMKICTVHMEQDASSNIKKIKEKSRE
jgi:hypothetical protein